MINSELKKDQLGNSGLELDTCISHKQPPISTKKLALTDVQNDNRVLQYHRESLFSTDGGPIADKSKICGTKRPIPESLTSHPFRPLSDRTTTKEHLVYTSKKLEPVQGNGKSGHNADRSVSNPLPKPHHNMQQEILPKQTLVLEDNTNHVSMATSNHTIPKNTCSYLNSPLDSLPISLANPGNGMGPAENDCSKVISKVPISAHSRRVDDRKWEERYIHLQNFLKMCDDESICRDHVQKLRHLTPAELSIYAVELERRAIQLTIEEGKELQRMKALKILEKSATTANPLQMSQPSQSKK
ncbi:hypothetical protein DCAR_0417052 [Daucus carota subsp. sativus]|uniref:Uncharacterized protein n=1 Tax=Daucus carota subsp. sativus TaxID=79200 RepID=A0A165XZV9_DAUCS|nr:PREDICTED: uncharacterized protein LOC108215609 [Daucus carota subsp. sativus]XP_017243609.1 PREDICTED: uncharacterized protein LOC108215609 [Daucus carota subsp. sativus]XP_017243610.1 PREDICTED: uncharacterized protein LOC108215609 [Daucus carota subsp. sativus]WOG97711.1 hypothetical protein DCAR_0417052 [Daucus carota subsp. sativus]